MPSKLIGFHNGLVTSRDPATLEDGELSEAVGCEYREGSTHIYKQPGRASCDLTNSAGAWDKTVIGGAVQAIQRFEYDVGTDRLIVYSSAGAIHEADVFSTSDTSTLPDAAILSSLSTTAIPSFASMRDQWVMVNGVDNNYLREGNAITTDPSTNWRTCGMVRPSATLTEGTAIATPANTQVSASLSGSYTAPSNAEVTTVDSTTYAYAQLSSNTNVAHVWEFGANLAGTGRVIRVVHSGETSVGALEELPEYKAGGLGLTDISATHKIQLSKDNGATYTEGTVVRGLAYGKQESIFPVTDGLDLLDYHVLCTTGVSNIGSSLNWARGRVFAIFADDNAGQTQFSTTNTIQYGFTERYYDSRGVKHESIMSQRLDITAQTDIYGVLLEGFPTTPANAFAMEYVVYRTLDEVGAGFPNMYEIGSFEIGTATTFVDTGAVSLTEVAVQNSIYETINVLYPDGATFAMDINNPPPLAKKVLQFQGSMVYVPPSSPRIHYSIPATISPAGVEQAPELYYLEFVTPYEDTVRSAQSANSGRSLIVYFARYSMLVNFLPQATDPGVFNQRVTEYVSNTRGALGVHTTAEITLESGRTLAIAVDALGVWATDGVSMIADWSDDLNWDALMASADLANARLIDNPKMYRIELLYDSDSAGLYKELHFHYKRTKGNGVPLITGPHPASTGTTDGWRSKFYALISDKWVGFSGGNDDGVPATKGPDEVSSDPLIWMRADDDTHGYLDAGDAVVLTESAVNNFTDFTDGPQGGSRPPLFYTAAGTEDMNGHACVANKATPTDLSLNGTFNADSGSYDDQVEITGDFTCLVIYGFESGGPANANACWAIGAGGGNATARSGLAVPNSQASVVPQIYTDDGGSGNLINIGSAYADATDGIRVGIFRRTGTTVKYFGTETTGDTQVDLSVTDANAGDEIHFNGLMNDGSSTCPTGVKFAEIVMWDSHLTDLEVLQLYQWGATRFNLTTLTSGGNSGDVFIERELAADESKAYDGTNEYVPFQVTSGDMYVEGLGKAGIIGFGYPKFGVQDATTKTLDPVASSSLQGFFGTFRRDGNSATTTKSKPMLIGTQRKLYWNMYADRHKIQVKDVSATALPEFVGYEIETRAGGSGRDK